MRILRWDSEHHAAPRRPYRDTALVYLGFAVLIVLLTVATGGRVLPGDLHLAVRGTIGQFGALINAAAFFVLAFAWTTWQWRRRARRGKEADS